MTKAEYNKRRKAIEKLPDDTLFYWQSYGFVGNCLNLWANGSAGYTTCISNAQTYTKEETLGQLDCQRDQDVFWTVEALSKAAKLMIDHQDLRECKSY